MDVRGIRTSVIRRSSSVLILWSVGHLGPGISPSQGRCLHRATQTRNKSRHKSMSRVSLQPMIPDIVCVRPRGHCNRNWIHCLTSMTMKIVGISVNYKCLHIVIARPLEKDHLELRGGKTKSGLCQWVLRNRPRRSELDLAKPSSSTWLISYLVSSDSSFCIPPETHFIFP
jgi:hypothetical protein